MFERELYESQPVPKSEPGDLFHEYEIRPWVLSARIYQILGVAAFLNIIGVFVLAQTNLLTMKGCESPFVGDVCQVIDTLYVGSMLATGDRDYVDLAYEKTDLGDADIIYIDKTGDTGPLAYPEGYFQIANPEQWAMRQQMLNDSQAITSGFPAFPNTTTALPPAPSSSILNRTPRRPRNNPNAVTGSEPDSLFSVNNDEDSKPSADKKPNGGAVAAQPSPSPDQNSSQAFQQLQPGQINRVPFVKLKETVNGKLADNKVKLDSPFSITFSAKLNSEAKFDNISWGKAEFTDQEMYAVVKESIGAFNDSGFLAILKDLNGQSLNVVMRQDDKQVTADVGTIFKDNNRANSMKFLFDIGLKKAIQDKAAGIEALKNAVATETDPGRKQHLQSELLNDMDDLVLLQGATIEASGKALVVKFAVDKQVMQTMIRRKLAEPTAPLQNNLGQARNQNTAVK